MKKLLSWNVNGLRSCWNKGLEDWLRASDADVVCLQEVKCKPEQWSAAFPAGWKALWNSAEKPGYSGTLTLVKQEPENWFCGIGEPIGDAEGRVMTVEFAQCYVVNVYTPNARNDLSRLDYRTTTWDVAFREHCRNLANCKPVLFCGDLNVAHQEIDLANPRSNRRNAGFTDEERQCFTDLLDAGFIDTFRHLCPEPRHYSWWSYRSGARARNVGWRIDYVGLSTPAAAALKSAWIEPQITGSDHCPVGVEIDF